jgi:hypothetical protein
MNSRTSDQIKKEFLTRLALVGEKVDVVTCCSAIRISIGR